MLIQVGESRPKKTKPFSEAVMFIEDTNHSHVFISWKDSQNRRWVAEAFGTGIRLLSNKKFKEKNLIVGVYDYETTDEGLENLLDFVWHSSAKEYAFAQIYGLLEMRLVNFVCRNLGFKYRHKNRFTDGAYSQICCEFILRGIIAATGIHLPMINVEQWGLKETKEFNLLNSYKVADYNRLKRINGVV